MCTAVAYTNGTCYFGRNLDLYYHYREEVTVTPRRYPFWFRNGVRLDKHYALIGTATVADGYPLYYEATNETGLSMAGLNFPDNAVYLPCRDGVSPFELIPWVLAQCADTDEAVRALKRTCVRDTPFSRELPLSPLHWLIADRRRCITAEPLSGGLRLTENPVGVLTNNPPFDYHLHRLTDHLNVTAAYPESRFSPTAPLTPYSLGMGALGLPGDPSSASRFVRAAFTKLNTVSDGTERQNVSSVFHILSSVAQQRGVTRTTDDRCEYTLYTSCCNADTGVYYYTTYDNGRITAVDMRAEDLDSAALVTYPHETAAPLVIQNKKRHP